MLLIFRPINTAFYSILFVFRKIAFSVSVIDEIISQTSFFPLFQHHDLFEYAINYCHQIKCLSAAHFVFVYLFLLSFKNLIMNSLRRFPVYLAASAIVLFIIYTYAQLYPRSWNSPTDIHSVLQEENSGRSVDRAVVADNRAKHFAYATSVCNADQV